VNAFNAWVADEVESLSGCFDDYCKGLQQECALTYAQTRMDACQELSDIYFQGKNVDSMLHFMSVSIH